MGRQAAGARLARSGTGPEEEEAEEAEEEEEEEEAGGEEQVPSARRLRRAGKDPGVGVRE